MNQMREQILQALANGNFLEVIDALSEELPREDKSLRDILVRLNNEHLVDLCEEFRTLKVDSGTVGFSAMRGVFLDALPDLKVDCENVLKTVEHLISEAGRDLNAGYPLQAYRNFCKANEARVTEALAEILESPDSYKHTLPSTLCAGSSISIEKYYLKTIELSKSDNTQLRNDAYRALAALDYQSEPRLRVEAMKALLLASAEIVEDEVQAIFLSSAFELFTQDAALEEKLILLLNNVVTHGQEQVQYQASQILWLFFGKINKSILEVILPSLYIIDPEHLGILRNIDGLLPNLFRAGYVGDAMTLLEQLLTNGRGQISMNQLEGSMIAIWREHEHTKILYPLITQWLLNGSSPLCHAVSEIIRNFSLHANQSPVPLEADVSHLDPDNTFDVIFTARKAVGYLFMQPVSAASFILSLLRQNISEEAHQHLLNLLWDPLLRNWSGLVGDYLQEQREGSNKTVSKACEDLLAHNKEYLERLSPCFELLELRPSISQREV